MRGGIDTGDGPFYEKVKTTLKTCMQKVPHIILNIAAEICCGLIGQYLEGEAKNHLS